MGGGGGGGGDFVWEPGFESVLSKITKYFAFCIFIVVKNNEIFSFFLFL